MRKDASEEWMRQAKNRGKRRISDESYVQQYMLMMIYISKEGVQGQQQFGLL